MTVMNMADRHIPSLMKNAQSKMQRLKLRIDDFEKLKETEISRKEEYLHEISEKDHEIKSMNFDLENAEDPVARPLETGQEVPRVEMWIREMESKVFYLQGDVALLKSKALKSNQLISTYKYHLSLSLKEVMQIQKKINKLETADFINRWVHNGSEYLTNENIIDINKDGEIIDNGEQE